MALFSDIDWVIVLAAAAFLLLGKDNSQLLPDHRVAGTVARAQVKQELLAEFTKAAELPAPVGGQLSIRGALLGLEPTPTQ